MTAARVSPGAATTVTSATAFGRIESGRAVEGSAGACAAPGDVMLVLSVLPAPPMWFSLPRPDLKITTVLAGARMLWLYEDEVVPC